jgi:4-hydroxy-3-methylbut-2-enyl diphosphate reductase
VRVVAPLRVEAMAVRGTRIGLRARRARPAGPLLLAGVAGAVGPGIRAGDLVVADHVFDGAASYPMVDAAALAGVLRAAGLTVHVGPIAGVDAIVTGAARAGYAAAGALAVDLESGVLARTGQLVAVVRAIVDTPAHPLVSLGTVPRGITALRSLRRAAPVLSAWVSGPGASSVRERQTAPAEPTVTLPGKVEKIQ